MRSRDGLAANLDERGWARLPGLLAADDCERLASLFDRDDLFRKTVDMERHRFGRGVYRYFADPLPPLVATLRRRLYPTLAVTARAWAARLGEDPAGFPPTLAGFRARCRDAGQERPTPLLLRYRAGDWNALHQDIYGAVAFPLQVVIVLSPPDAYRGGEVVLVEQRPRSQSRAWSLALAQGEGLVFTNRDRPIAGARGDHRVRVRHGVSELLAGERTSLGIIFHDAV